MIDDKFRLIVHASNISGKGRGAYELIKSLVPAIDRKFHSGIVTYIFPKSSALSDYVEKGRVEYKKRWLPNIISRTLECTLEYNVVDNATLLVMGDLPLVFKNRQILYLHRPQYVEDNKSIKDIVSRFLLRRNLKYVDTVVVQTESMKSKFLSKYIDFSGNCRVVGAPPPSWFIAHEFAKPKTTSNYLRCFYPAIDYPHKNHKLLAQLLKNYSTENIHFKLTVGKDYIPDLDAKNVECLGVLTPNQVLRNYERSDVLLFLSKTESYGLPLIEAMICGLQIIAPDLPYARDLCGDSAIYFDPNDIISLKDALSVAKSRQNSGYITDWSSQLKLIPKSWDEVITNILIES